MASEFETCGKWLLENGADGWVVCHGLVVGKYDEDLYQHCWIEYLPHDKALVLTTGKPILVNARDYRHANSAFTIDEFDAKQVRSMLAKFNHFGPYDKDLIGMPERILH